MYGMKGIAEFFYMAGGRWFAVSHGRWWIEFAASMPDVDRALMAQAHAKRHAFRGYRLGEGEIVNPVYTTKIIPTEVTVSQQTLDEFKAEPSFDTMCVELTIEDWRQRRDMYRAQIGTDPEAEKKLYDAKQAIKSFNRNGKLPRWALRDK